MADDLERAGPLLAQRGPERNASLIEDFFTGCGTLLALGLVVFVVVPFFLFVVKASLAIAIPVAVLALVVFLIAVLGRLVRILRSRW
jgi:hypothetical protein